MTARSARLRRLQALAMAVVVLSGTAAADQDSRGTEASTSAPTPPVQPFADWLAGVRAEALTRGISAKIVDEAFQGLEPLPIVVERDRNQAEAVLPLDAYLSRRLTPKMIRTGRHELKQHRTLLARVGARYGVPSSIQIAIWGVESNFGRFSGVRPTVATLATLAYDPRRSAMFREELFAALTILDKGDIDLERMKGSWAGAMGQPQFMPSSYLKHAEDFDGDGRRNIWNAEPDILASIANYLKTYGWTEGERWGRAVHVTNAGAEAIKEQIPLRTVGCRALREMTEPQPLSRWSELGVMLPNRKPLPSGNFTASFFRAGKQTYLLYRNYEAILGYNCAHAYALGVVLLADRIAGG